MNPCFHQILRISPPLHTSLVLLLSLGVFFVQEGTPEEKQARFRAAVENELVRPSDKRVFAVWEAFEVMPFPPYFRIF